MKAIVFTQYGSPDVLELKEVAQPAPTDNQVLVKVAAVALNALDGHSLQGPPVIRIMNGAVRRPKNTTLGVDVAGWVEAVGKNVTQFKPGDAVFGVAQGALAEYVCASEQKLALKPENVSFAAAAAVPVAGFTALQVLRDKGHIEPGQKVLINGASGGVGTFAVQLAVCFGAEVTAVCSSRNLDMARSLGADHVIDYTREDFTQNGQRYDLIVAVNGYHPIWAYRRALSSQGIYLAAGGDVRQVIQAMLWGRLLSKIGSQKLDFMGIAKTNQADLLVLRDLLASGQIVPVIDRCYGFSEAADALRYLGEGHAQGKIVITVTEFDKVK